MEQLTLPLMIEVLAKWGSFGIVCLLWYFDQKSVRGVLASYKEDMKSIREMYEHNVSLVKSYEKLADDLHDVVIMNTAAMTKLEAAVVRNQFCPMVRLNKDAQGVQA